MPESQIKPYHLLLIIYKEWQQQINIEEVANKINTSLGCDFISSEKVEGYYEQFEKRDITIFDKGPLIHVFSTIQFDKPKFLINSLVLFERDENLYGKNFLTNDSRYLICPHKKFSIIIYDLLNGTKKTIPLSFKTSYKNFTVVGPYLFALRRRSLYKLYKLHILKIDYDNLNVEEIEALPISYKINGIAKILPDQLKSHKFLIHNNVRFLTGQIQNGKIVLDDVKILTDFVMCGKRFIGGKLQGFLIGSRLNALHFCEVDLDSKEKIFKSAAKSLQGDELPVKSGWMSCYCWSDQNFYCMLKMSHGPNKLGVFNLEISKWIDIDITAKRPLTIFVDEDEILTLQTGHFNGPQCVYRIALKKPDKLMTLTRFAALGESTLFGNDKYLTIARKIPILF